MAELYTDPYIEQCFYVWYENGKVFGKSLLDKLPKTEKNNVPSIITIQKWADDYGWVERADALDAEVSVRQDELVIDKRLKMYERLAEIGEFEAEEGFKYLKEHGIKKEETALRAISDGSDLMQKSVGVAEAIKQISSMTPDQLDKAIQKLLGQKQESEFIQGEVTEEEK